MANISLTPQLEEFVQQQVKSGRYGTISEVVRDALRLMEEKQKSREEKLQALRDDIAVATKELREGKGIDGAEVFARLRADLAVRDDGVA